MRCTVSWLLGLVLAGGLAGAAFGVPGDVVYKREGPPDEGLAPAVFPHWIHRIRYKCYVCHPSLFAMRAGADKATMEDMVERGQSCGACHNDKVAWKISFQTCNRCHRPAS